MSDTPEGAPAPTSKPDRLKFLRDLLTEKDGVTYCLVRWLSFLSAHTGLALMAWAAIKDPASFHFKEFCEGVGLMVAGVGAAIGVKAATKAEAGQ